MRKFDAPDAVRMAQSISFPRLVGGSGEVRGREKIKEMMSQAGLQVDEQPFVFYPGLAWGILRNLLFTGLALLLAYRFLLSHAPRWGALLGLAVPIIAKQLWAAYRRASAEKLEDKSGAHPIHARFIANARMQLQSANLVADLPYAGPIRHHLVLSAHTDTKSQNMSIVTRATMSILFGFGVFLLPIVTLPGLIWPAWLIGFTGAIWWTLWLLAVAGGVVLSTLKVRDESAGALDDAGACGLLLGTAKSLMADPPQGVAVRLVFTGAEELGLAGGYAYARQAIADPDWKKALHLNFEGVGGGSRVWLTTGTGPVKTGAGSKADAMALAVKACFAAGIEPKKLSRIIGGEADHIPLVEAGLSALTLMFAGKGGLAVHTAGDRPELIKEQHMNMAGKIALAAVNLLEEQK